MLLNAVLSIQINTYGVSDFQVTLAGVNSEALTVGFSHTKNFHHSELIKERCRDMF